MVKDMNNLIKELAKSIQCDRHWTENDIEKFAKLIVKECINKIETYRIPVGNSSAGEMACEWTYDALKEIRDDIKETFGLK